MKELKHFVKKLIWYYYNDLDNPSGGNLHIVLDDGNIEHANIMWCRDKCEEDRDTFGIFLCDFLMQFTETELWDLYDNDWWGMDSIIKP